ncbi:MAG: hypothetical protein Q9159_007159 [Coniocarpon cinnabarinum]
MSPAVPRVFLVRHGETEWSLNGRHTGVTDIPLTANGEKRIKATGRALVGPDRLIVPSNLAAVFVSPRKRAQDTFNLLVTHGLNAPTIPDSIAQITTTRPEVAEWNYGAYEGITTARIQDQRASKGLPTWDIWRDGCPDGESPQDVTKRCDSLIHEIREKFHRPVIERASKGETECGRGDALIVAHGHFLRAFAARWVGEDLERGVRFLLEAGGVGTLSYEHHNISEPAIMLGGAFVVDALEHVEREREQEERKGYAQAPLGV